LTKRLLVLVAIAALAVTACSEEAAPDQVASLETAVEDTLPVEADETDSDTAADAEEAFLAFSACLREEGIEIGDPEVGSDVGFGVMVGGSEGEMDFEAFEAAQEKCAVHLEGVSMEFEPPDLTELEDELLEFAACMRDNGVEMDDPDLTNPGGDDGGVVIEPFGGSVNPNDPAFQEAFEACEGILSDFGPGQP
jgi:hypothetical protein